MGNAQQYLTEEQTAAILGMGRSTLAKGRVWREGAAANLAFFKIGRSVRYSMADVEAFMAARRIDPTTGAGGAAK